MYDDKIPKLTKEDIARELSSITSKKKKEENLASIEHLLDLAIAAAKELAIDDALFFIGKLTELDPNDVRPFIIRARLYLDMNNIDAAKSDIEYLLWLAPKDIKILELKAVLDERLHYNNLNSQFRMYS